MTWAQSAQASVGQQAQFIRSLSGGCDQRQAFQQLQQLQSAASAPAATLAALAPTAHRCTRFCEFEHLFGNVFLCRSSGSHHCCDSNCDQTVRVDPYSSVCRLSKKVFHTPQLAARQSSMKRMSEEALTEGHELLESTAKRQSCVGMPQNAHY